MCDSCSLARLFILSGSERLCLKSAEYVVVLDCERVRSVDVMLSVLLSMWEVMRFSTEGKLCSENAKRVSFSCTVSSWRAVCISMRVTCRCGRPHTDVRRRC